MTKLNTVDNIDLYNIIESSHHGIWIWDLYSNYAFYSDEYKRQLGFENHEFSNSFDEFYTRVHPQDRNLIDQAITEYTSGITDAYQCEFRILTKDETYIWMLAIGKGVANQTGSITHLSGTHTNITTRKNLEIALLDQQCLLKSLVKNSPDLVWLKGQDGEYLATNSRFEDFFGYPSEEIIGKTDYDFVRAEIADFLRQNDQIAIDRGSPVANEETITFASDGHIETLETIKTPIFDEHNKFIGILGVGRDISERKKAQEALSLAASVFTTSHDCVVICKSDGLIYDVNPGFELTFGYSKNEVIGKNPSIISSGKHDESFYKSLWDELIKNGSWQGEIWNRHKDGTVIPVLESISAVKNEQGDTTHYVSILTNITKMKSHQAELEYMAHYDLLTGLPNRNSLSECIDKERELAKLNNTSLVIGFIDLDNFKKINDQYGNSKGDAVLQSIADRLKKLVNGKLVARFGGDEFVFIISTDKSSSYVKNLTKELLLKLTRPIIHHAEVYDISASIGITMYPYDNSNTDTLIRHANQALYSAKMQGRNKISFFDVEANDALKSQNQLSREILHALRSNEFILHFQPKMDYHNNLLCGFEALIRWQHPIKGLLYPNDFLPQIEHLSLLKKIEEWVVEEACKLLQNWFIEGKEFTLSINISSDSLLSVDFIEKIINKLSRLDENCAKYLEIEILETSSFENLETVKSHITKLKKMGIQVSLDDFGTGTSSLRVLKELPVDVVKIDRSFVLNLLDDDNDLAIIKGIIELSKVFGFAVVAEGVESAEIAEKLFEIGCNIHQGYWISRPLPYNQLESFIATRQAQS